MRNQPLVSVILPTFKRSVFLLKAVNSVLNQTYENIQLLIVDDNDGENIYRKETRALLLKTYPTKPFEYIEHEVNKGVSEARNTGMAVAKGGFIAFIDDDDEWLPEKVKKQVDLFMLSKESIGLVYSGYFEVNSSDQVFKTVFPKHRGDLSKILGVNQIGSPSSVMIKSEVLKQVSGFRDRYPYMQDLEFYYRVSKICLFDFLPMPLMNYRVHENNATKNVLLRYEDLERFISEYKTEIVKPNLRWSEIMEMKGELAVSLGMRKIAFQSFLSSYINRPKRVVIFIKLILSPFGRKIFFKLTKAYSSLLPKLKLIKSNNSNSREQLDFSVSNKE